MATLHQDEHRARGANAWGFVPQRTLKAPIHCKGVGLHSGEKVQVVLAPAEPDTGITFVRTDVRGRPAIPGRWDHVIDTRLCTVLGNDARDIVGTVEHLMSALAGTGVDNAVVEIDGPEVPIMDGSAEPFVFLIECAGLVEQARPRRAVRILEPLTVAGDGWQVSLQPADSFVLGMEIEFQSRAIARQSIDFALAAGDYKAELASARTFGFLHEVEQLRAAGLARGGSLSNVVVVDGDTIVNEDGLRFADEFVRHKALDALGDLYLAGAPILGRFHGTCSGHNANNRLLRTLFAHPAAWTWDILRPGDRWFNLFDSDRHAVAAGSA